MRRADGGGYGKLAGVPPGSDVYDVAALWASSKRLDSLDPALITLSLVQRAPGAPDALAETKAQLLEPRLALRAAGLADGSSLVATVGTLQRVAAHDATHAEGDAAAAQDGSALAAAVAALTVELAAQRSAQRLLTDALAPLLHESRRLRRARMGPWAPSPRTGEEAADGSTSSSA